MWYPRLASLAIAIAAAAGAYFFAMTIIAMETPGMDALKNPLEVAMAFAVVVLSVISYLGLWGIVTSFAVERTADGCFQPRQSILGRVFRKTGAAQADTFCGASTLFAMMMAVSLMIAFVIGFLLWHGFAGQSAIVLDFFKAVGMVVGLIGGVLLALWVLLWFAANYPKIGMPLALIVCVSLVTLMVRDLYSDMDGEKFREMLNTMLAFAIVAGSVLGLILVIKRMPGYRAICPISVKPEQTV